MVIRAFFVYIFKYFIKPQDVT